MPHIAIIDNLQSFSIDIFKLVIFFFAQLQAMMCAGFVCLEPTKELSGDRKNEEDAIMSEAYLSDPSAMISLKEQFIVEHNALLALSTHGPMLVSLMFTHSTL